MSGFIKPIARPEAVANRALSVSGSPLTGVFTPQYLSNGCFITTLQPGNASTPTKTY
jgi:hypothetical protein